MSSLTTVLIADDCAVADALRQQFHSRGRDYAEYSPDKLSAVGEHLLRGAVVIDLCWGEELRARTVLRPDFYDQWRDFVARCARGGGRYLMLSSACLYHGMENPAAPVDEHFAPHPEGPAEQLLHDAEQTLAATADLQWLVLRSGPVLYNAPGSPLFESLGCLREERARVLENRHPSCPTPPADLARVLSAMNDQLVCGADCAGVYHYNSSGACGFYEFVEVVHAYAAQFMPATSNISEDDSGECWQPWMPVLSCQRLLANFGIKQLPWRAWLPKLIKSYCGEEN